MPTPAIAANAYAQLARITENGGGLAKTIGASGGGLAQTIGAPGDGAASFGALLKEALDGVNAAGRKSDQQAQALAAGKASVVDVVTAVAEAETAVSVLVAVRDSVIQSYQQVMSMPI